MKKLSSGIILLMFLVAMASGGMMLTTFGSAVSAIRYRGRGPDKVTVEDFAKGKVHPEDYVSVQGATQQALRIHFTLVRPASKRALESTTETDYDLLVSPNDAVFKNRNEMRVLCTRLLGLTDAEVNRMPEAKVNSLKAEIAKVFEFDADFDPHAVVPIAHYQFPGSVSPSGGNGDIAKIRSEARKVETLLAADTVITGTVDDLPEQMQKRYGKTLSPPPKLYINAGYTPDTFFTLIFVISLILFIVSSAIVIMWMRAK